MGFSYAGNLGGAGAPVVRRFQHGQTCYVGQFLQSGQFGGLGGQVHLADVATETYENDQPLIGFVSAVADESRTHVASTSGATEAGDRSTYTTSIGTILANKVPGQSGGGEVDVTLAIPGVTLIRAPIYATVWGTALTEIVCTTEDTDGTQLVGNASTDVEEDFGTMYCRKGANRGHSRIITTSASTTDNTVTIPFPHTIAVDDVYVIASCVLGYGGMQFTTAIDAIDGNDALGQFYSVYYHELNLEESGKEYAIFALWPQSVTTMGV